MFVKINSKFTSKSKTKNFHRAYVKLNRAMLNKFQAIFKPRYPKLFGAYHVLGFIRGTLGYNLYLVRYVQQVPFFHNIHHLSSYPGTVNIANI